MPRVDLDALDNLPLLVAAQFRLETAKVVVLHRMAREFLLREPRYPASMGTRHPYVAGIYDAGTNPTFQEALDCHLNYPVSLDMFEIKTLNAYEKKLKKAQQPCTLLGYYGLLIPILMLEPRRLLLKKAHATP